MQRGVDGLFRMHQRRKFDFRGGRQLGIEDHIVTWTKPQRPEWMDEETYAQIPNELKIRELRFKDQQPGFRVNELVLVTTYFAGLEGDVRVDGNKKIVTYYNANDADGDVPLGQNNQEEDRRFGIRDNSLL